MMVPYFFYYIMTLWCHWFKNLGPDIKLSDVQLGSEGEYERDFGGAETGIVWNECDQHLALTGRGSSLPSAHSL